MSSTTDGLKISPNLPLRGANSSRNLSLALLAHVQVLEEQIAVEHASTGAGVALNGAVGTRIKTTRVLESVCKLGLEGEANARTKS